jgi:SNF2 family DNA or RNA helicase
MLTKSSNLLDEYGYDWPIEKGRTPLAHQKQMAEFMVEHQRCFNLSDMGTMKTLSTLWAADFIMRHYQGECRAIIICPLSITQSVWGSAIFSNFLSRRTYKLIYGDAKKRRGLLAEKADFYIINFDGVGVGATRAKQFRDGIAGDLQHRDDIKIAIIDEGSAYREASTKRHRIAQATFGQRMCLWLLTGTPTPNAPTDAYGLARLLGTSREGFVSYRNRVMQQVSKFKWVPRSDGYEQARKLLQPAIRYELKDIWDGPRMTTQQREVLLTPGQRDAMRQLKRDLQVVVQSGAITAVNEASARQKFMQISLGAIYDAAHEAHAIDVAPRLAEVRQVIAEAPGKLLVFAPLTSVINMLYKELNKEIDCVIVNGETPQRDRTAIFAAFQRDDTGLRMLIADPGTMAHGLDLWRANYVVWYGPTDRTELYLQANARAYRPGQKHPVTVVQIVSNQLEKEIFRRLGNNERLQGLLLQMVKEGKI